MCLLRIWIQIIYYKAVGAPKQVTKTGLLTGLKIASIDQTMRVASVTSLDQHMLVNWPYLLVNMRSLLTLLETYSIDPRLRVAFDASQWLAYAGHLDQLFFLSVRKKVFEETQTKWCKLFLAIFMLSHDKKVSFSSETTNYLCESFAQSYTSKWGHCSLCPFVLLCIKKKQFVSYTTSNLLTKKNSSFCTFLWTFCIITVAFIF